MKIMDEQIKRLCRGLNIQFTGDLSVFNSQNVKNSITQYLSTLSASTAENYIWHLYRALLKEQASFSPSILRYYHYLYLLYHRKYSGPSLLPKP
jgi:hypothetical protein